MSKETAFCGSHRQNEPCVQGLYFPRTERIVLVAHAAWPTTLAHELLHHSLPKLSHPDVYRVAPKLAADRTALRAAVRYLLETL